MPSLRRGALVVVCLTVSVLAATGTAATATRLDLRVDANRDGRVTAADEPGKRTATLAAGALVLPNLDDDAGRCPAYWRRLLKAKVTLNALIDCSDAATPGVDGPADRADMAPLDVMPISGIADGDHATIALTGPYAGRGRLHGAGQDGTSITLDAATLRAGVVLWVEALEPAHAHDAFDGELHIAAEIDGDASSVDAVTLRVAPLIATSGAADATRIYTAVPASKRAIDLSYSRALTALLSAVRPGDHRGRTAARARIRAQRAYAHEEADYVRRLPTALRLGAGGPPIARVNIGVAWMQDHLEVMTAAVPRATSPGGIQSMQVALADEPTIQFGELSARNPAVVHLMSELRTYVGPGRGALMPRLGALTDGRPEFDASGALEATPPVPGAPAGRILLSAPPKGRDQFAAMLRAQAQPVVELPVRWLDVGHVDEIASFVPAATPRGWALVLADPALALRLTRHDKRIPPSIHTATQQAATHMVTVERTLRRALGLGRGDTGVIRVPVLFARATSLSGGLAAALHPGLTAWSANSVNGLHVRGRNFIVPAPHRSPALAPAIRRAFADKGVAIRFFDTFPAPHGGEGELHCTTNAERVPVNGGAWW